MVNKKIAGNSVSILSHPFVYYGGSVADYEHMVSI